jgi:hypothetical protein
VLSATPSATEQASTAIVAHAGGDTINAANAGINQ